MKKNTNANVLVLTHEDLLPTSKGKTHVTVNDFSSDARKASIDSSVVIFIDESKVKSIIEFDNALVEEPGE